jgi:hypothetical protein
VIPSSGPILPPQNVGTVSPRPAPRPAVQPQPSSGDDANPHGFHRQSLPQGPSQGEKNLLQRLIGG